MNRIQNKVVLITGATSGIGRACAIAFANKGAKVIIVGRRNEQLSGTRIITHCKSRQFGKI